MNKLITANLCRLKKNKLFYAVMLLYALYFFWNLPFINALQKSGDPRSFFDMITLMISPTMYIMMFPLALGIVGSIFISEDFQSGAIRNKIIVGRTKTQVYLVNAITVTIIGVALITMYLLFSVTIGGFVLGYEVDLTAFELITTILVSYGIVIAYASIITFITMLFKNMTASVLICIGFILFATYCSFDLVMKLDLPDTYMAYVFENGAMVKKEFINEMKLSPLENEIARFFTKFMPSGQVNYITYTNSPLYSEKVDGAEIIMLLYSIILTIAVNITGLFIFKKSNLK